nr:Uncharacterised protein family UPF0057 domain containing protein [Haemonchus contortus]
MCCTILLCILAVICPPIAVLLDQGCTNQFWINILLTILIWIPGVIHAFWRAMMTASDPDRNKPDHPKSSNYMHCDTTHCTKLANLKLAIE